VLLEDGSVSLVVNPTELVDRFNPSRQATIFRPGKPKEEWRPPTILVVDDSFTTRTLETSILETNGYTVLVAVDGIEALQRLRSEKVDLVVTDVQMPRLDGFGLLEAMKADTRLATIPVIVVTSIDRSEDQERGLNLGAEAYIVKQKFDHQELLKTIQQIL
jgi:two-component system chemotaxis sensor kinase CheA